MLDPRQWLEVRKKLYEKVHRQVQMRLGPSLDRLAPYTESYEKEFSDDWIVSSNAKLFQEIRKSDVVFIGDFHSLRQAQKVQLKLTQQIAKQSPLILGVEFIESAHQAYLDSYLNGDLDEEEFLSHIGWDERWGFYWEHYRPILEWAKNHQVRVMGLNRFYKQRSLNTLRRRDKHAAKLITEMIEDNPGYKLVVLFGELHLAWDHLPSEVAQIKPDITQLRVFQNSDNIYLQLAEKGLENEVDYVQLGLNSYCVFSVAPWVKWQNYLMFLEQTYDVDFDDDEIDYTDHVGELVKVIAEALDEKVGLDHLSVYLVNDENLRDFLISSLNEGEELAVKTLISEGISFYIPKTQLAVLVRPTLNHSAYLAAQYVHAILCQSQGSYWQMPNDFLRQIWIQTISYFGAKLLNPKRKTPMLLDLKLAVGSKGERDQTKQAMLIALDQKMRDLMYLKQKRRFSKRIESSSSRSYLVAARLLGGILGEKLFAGYQKGEISQKVLAEFIKVRLDGDDFEEFYYNMIECVEPLPIYFSSKADKL